MRGGWAVRGGAATRPLSHLTPFVNREVWQKLVQLLPLHVHRRDLHVRLKHLAADGLPVDFGKEGNRRHG